MQGTATGQTFDTSLIEMALTRFGAMIRALADEFGYEYEDLRQDLAVVMLEHFQTFPRNQWKLKCYLRTCAKRLLINRYRSCSHLPTVSLDAPLPEEDETRLSDLLAAPPDQASQDTTEQDWKVATLYAALRRLPLDEQRYVREVYGLNAYQPVVYDYKTPEKDRTRNAINLALYRHLRSDAQLKAEVLS